MERTTRMVISLVALLVIVGAVYWFLFRGPCNQGVCKVSIEVTGFPCTADKVVVTPDPLDVTGPNNIQWKIVNSNTSTQWVKFVPSPDGIVFTGQPEMPAPGEFKVVLYQDDQIHMHDTPREGHHVYKYAVNLSTSSGACSKDPTIGNNG